MYAEPHRHYHNQQHIADCLNEFAGFDILPSSLMPSNSPFGFTMRFTIRVLVTTKNAVQISQRVV
jgi:hypothetical protein